MGWAKKTIIAAGVLTASAAVATVAATSPQNEVQKRRERVIVTPQIQVFDDDRVQLGVSLRDLDEAAAKQHKLAAPEGALVQRVEPGSAAEKAGIKAGDVIVAFDGERVRSVRQLQRLVTDTPPDRSVKIAVLRDGKKTEVAATLTKAAGGMQLSGDEWRLDELLGEAKELPHKFRWEWYSDQAPGDLAPKPRTPGAPQRKMPFELMPDMPRFPFNGWTSGAQRLGVVVQELGPQLGEYFGAKEGALVASVTDGSPAAQAGLKAGDVITTINGKAIKDVEALVSAIRAQPDAEEMAIGIVRDHKPLTLKVKLLGTTRARPI